MKSEDGSIIHAVLWLTVIYFNMRTRKSEMVSAEIKNRFEEYLVKLDQKDFQSRVNFLRSQNKINKS